MRWVEKQNGFWIGYDDNEIVKYTIYLNAQHLYDVSDGNHVGEYNTLQEAQAAAERETKQEDTGDKVTAKIVVEVTGSKESVEEYLEAWNSHSYGDENDTNVIHLPLLKVPEHIDEPEVHYRIVEEY